MIVDRRSTLLKLKILMCGNPILFSNKTFLTKHDAGCSNFMVSWAVSARWMSRRLGFAPQPHLQSAQAQSSQKVLQARPIPLKYRIGLALLNRRVLSENWVENPVLVGRLFP